MTVNDLVNAFEKLSEAEQRDVFKRVMPALYAQFSKDPQQMMSEMMPLCREMMQGCGVDPQQVMGMGQKTVKKLPETTDVKGE